jgi:hypothetical protein
VQRVAGATVAFPAGKEGRQALSGTLLRGGIRRSLGGKCVGRFLEPSNLSLINLWIFEGLDRHPLRQPPSPNDLRTIGGLFNGVSDPSEVKVKQRFDDASSGDAGWFCA